MMGVGYILQGRTFMQLPSDSPEMRALLYEKFDALLDECNSVIDNAEHRRTFHDFVRTKAHDFLQEILLQKMQEKITTIEKNRQGKAMAPL